MTTRNYDLCSHPSGCREHAAGSDKRGPLCAKHLQGGTLVLTFKGFVERETYSIMDLDAAAARKPRAA